MSSTAEPLPAAWPSYLRAVFKPGNVLPALVWLFFVVNQAVHASFPPALATVLLMLINSVALVLFLVRRDATRVGNRTEMVIAVSGTFIVAFLQPPEERRLFASVIQLVALACWAASLLTLGRSFGIVPADRGLIQHGPYRYIRHPIYAFEGLFVLGYLINAPTAINAGITVLWWALQTARIIREERILEGYEEYRRRVRWRILPGVW